MFVVDRIRNRICEIFAHGGEFGIAAVMIPTRETCIGAEVLSTAPAVGAHAAGFTQPSDADSRPDGEAFAPRPELLDDTDHLVTRDDLRMLRLEVTLADMQIRSADATRLYPHEYLALTGNGHPHLNRSQRVRFDLRRTFEHHRVHARHTPLCD